MKVHLRQKKLKNKGLISLYLEYYKGSYKDENGKVKTNREFEFLDIYLKEKPRTIEERERNKEQKQLAENIRSKREVEDKTSKEGIFNPSKQKANFYEYMKKLSQNRGESNGTKGGWKGALKQFKEFAGTNILFQDIDKQFCEDFKEFLKNKAKTKSGNNLKFNSRISYFNKFKAALKQAIMDEIIAKNPAMNVNMPKEQQPERQFLTQDEINSIAETPCRYEVLKRAFLFSCLTGLRWSDIQKLTWRDIQDRPDGYFIHFRQQKTSGFEYHPISPDARNMLGKPGEQNDRVFIGLKYSSYTNVALTQWMVRAGVTKEITFHCGRHTFAVNFLLNGGDIYTLSKHLGHSDLTATLVYAKVVDQKKNESVAYAPTIGNKNN